MYVICIIVCKYLCSCKCVHVLVECCIGFVVCMYVRSSAEERPCRALELKSINQSIKVTTVASICVQKLPAKNFNNR